MSSMQHPTHSPEYKTERLSWPKSIPRVCPLCRKLMRFKFADGGKLVHTREGTVYQVMNLYACVDPNCPMHATPFNPAPRFDYGDGYYGADVFRYVADEVLRIKSKPEQVFLHLEAEGVPVSLSTVQRMCDDALNLAAFKIDEKTREMLAADPRVLLGWDGEDPGEGGRATWLFLDVLKGRVLHTCVVDGMDYLRLHDVLEGIRTKFGIIFIGFVTDKQGLIVKCVQEFYPGVPHQYDQFHFLNNQWKHAVALDSNVYMALRKVINGLYIHKVNRAVTAKFKGEQRQSVREVFKPVDDDLQVMAKVRNETFEQLRGVWLFEKLREYVAGMERLAKSLDPKARFARIFEKTRKAIVSSLDGVRKQYEDARLLFDLFQPIREGLQDPERHWLDQQVSLDDHYKKVWALAVEKDLKKDFEELTTFQAHKDATLAEVLGEWCRLWESYRPGLFQYVHFPVPIKTNNGCESAFGKQKQRAYGRVAKWNVAHLVETRGEAYLRVTHCDPGELKANFADVYSTYLVRQMREQQHYKIHARTQYWRTQARDYDGCQRAIAEYYDHENTAGDSNVQGRQKD